MTTGMGDTYTSSVGESLNKKMICNEYAPSCNGAYPSTATAPTSARCRIQSPKRVAHCIGLPMARKARRAPAKRLKGAETVRNRFFNL